LKSIFQMAQIPQEQPNAKVPSVKLNDGTSIPQLGFGTYLLNQQKNIDIISYAIKLGYYHLDTARFYENENLVGQAIINSKIPREKLYITTKLWQNDHGTKKAEQAVESSLKKLNTKYIDLYLIHSPYGDKNIETYEALIEKQKEGKIKSIGVSNFGIEHLEKLKEAGLPLPVVNQIELHPWLQQKDIVSYCQKNNIVIEAYSPLTKGQQLKNPDESLCAIAEKYKKSIAQILIKWSLQKGYVCLPKSANKNRIQENFEVWDFEINDNDMKIIETLEQDFHCTWDPTKHDAF